MDTEADKAMNYRNRAEHLRVIADGMTNRESQEATLKVAGDYERLAATIETIVWHIAIRALGLKLYRADDGCSRTIAQLEFSRVLWSAPLGRFRGPFANSRSVAHVSS